MNTTAPASPSLISISLPTEIAEITTEVTPEVIAAPPCYFANVCARRASVEKAGRSVCERCSANLRGFEYPLRGPSPLPLYPSGRAVAEAMNIVDE